MRWLPAAILVAACSAPAVDIPGGGPGIGFDDLRYSPRLHRVLVPGGRSGNLALIDPDSHAVTTIGGFSTTPSFDAAAHDFGVTSVDDLGGLLAVTDRTSLRVSLVDVDRAVVVADAPTGGGPDYVRWVPSTSELWVTEPNLERIQVFSVDLQARTLQVTASIAVPGGPESLVIDERGGRAFTHLWNGGTVSIDVATRVVGPTWRNGCNGSRGIAFDEVADLVFAGCAEGRLTALDATRGRVISEVWDLDGIDVIDYSPALRHVYAAGQISANLGIFGVSLRGELALLGLENGTLYGHCVTTDDAGHAFVCDPRGGRILVDDDGFAEIRR